MTSDQTFVVIGAGQAGGWTAKTLRDEGFEGRVVIVGDEPYPPHERPPLSKDVLLGNAEWESCLLWPPGTLEEAGIEMTLGVGVGAIDAEAHTVTLADGSVLSWDRLMIATGGRARRLDAAGADLDGVFTLRAIADTEAIRPRLVDGAKVVVVGAGWIGLEVAAAARKRGAPVVVLEVAGRVCARALTPEMSAWVHALHERNGVDIRLNTGTSRFEGDGKLERVVLTDGSVLDADVAVVGIGIVPNVELAEAAGLAVDNGIVVDETGRTSHPDIFAAGDVTNHPNPILGRRVRLESWENAQNQAIAAARAMLGGTDSYSEIPWFWSDQYDANIQLMGLPVEWDETVVRGDRDAGEFVEYYLKAGRIQGAAGVNNPRDIRFTRRLMLADKAYDPVQLADPSVKLQALLKG